MTLMVILLSLAILLFVSLIILFVRVALGLLFIPFLPLSLFAFSRPHWFTRQWFLLGPAAICGPLRHIMRI